MDSSQAEGSQGGASGSIPVRRITFDSAYTRLEQTMRDYSREKLNLQETINSLQEEIVALKSSLNKRDKEIQEIAEENRSLRQQHEDDETKQDTANALLETLNEREAVISSALERFHFVEHDLQTKCAENQDDLAQMKVRLLQLMDIAASQQQEIQTRSLQTIARINATWDEVQINHHAEINGLNRRIQEAQERSTLMGIGLNSARTQIVELNKDIEGLNTALKEEKLSHQIEVQELNNKLQLLEVSKQEAESKNSQLLKEVESSQCQLSELFQKTEGLNVAFNEAQSCHQIEVDEFNNKLQLLEVGKQELEDKNSQLLKEVESSQCKLSELFQKTEELNVALNEAQSCHQVQVDELNNKIQLLEVGKQASEDKNSQLLKESQCKLSEFLQKTEELNVALNEAKAHHEAELDELNKKLQLLELGKQESEDKNSQLLKEVESSQCQLSELLQKTDELNVALNEAQSCHQIEVQELNNKLQLLEVSKKESEDRNSQLLKEIDSAQSRLSELLQKIDGLTTTLNIGKAYHKAELEELNNKVRLLEVSKQEAESKNSLLLKEVDSSQCQLSELLRKIEGLTENRTSPFRYSSSMGLGSVRNTPSGILRTSRSSSAEKKSVKWNEPSIQNTTEYRRSKVQEAVKALASVSDDESEESAGEKDDPTFELPIKRARISDKESLSSRSSSSASSNLSSSAKAVASGKPSTPVHYKFFKDRQQDLS